MEKQSHLPKITKLLTLERVGHMGFLEAKEITLKKLRAFAGGCYARKVS